MLITKREVRTTSKKLLSVLLAVIMMMSSMSVCFGVSVSAAGGSATDAQWTALANALKNDTVKGATFSGEAHDYVVSDPDGKILAAVEAYYTVFNAIANRSPACGSPNNTSASTGSSEGNRTINQVNSSIKTKIKSTLGDTVYANYNVEAFLTGLLAGANVSSGTGATKTVGGSTSNDKTVPSTDLASISDIKLTVMLESAVTGYTLSNLPNNVVTSKSYTVKHKNSNYNYTYSTGSTGGCNSQTTYTRTYAFFYNISAKVSGVDGASVSTTTIKNTQTTLETNASYFTMSTDELVATAASTLNTVSSAVSTAKQNVVDDFGAGVYTHFFESYDVDTLVSNIALAKEIQNYLPISERITAYAETDYSAYNYSQLNTLYNNLKTEINNYKPASTDVKSYISGKGFDLAAAEAELIAIDKEIKLIEIREAKAVADAHMATYNAYTTEQIDEGTLTSAMIAAALSAISADISKLNSYNSAYVTEVCGSDYMSKLNSCKAHLNDLATAAGYNDKFAAAYAEFASAIITSTDVSLSDDDLTEGLSNYDSWYSGLKSLINEMKSVLGEDLANALFDELDAPMTVHMEAAYEALNTRVEAQINAAYDLFTAFLAAYPDGAVDFKNVSQYNAMKVSIGLINVDAYNFLKGSSNFSISQDTVNKYNALQRKFPDFDAFVESMGFSEFETTEIEDVIREDTIEDIARENEDIDSDGTGEYVVDDAKVLEVIGKLDALITDPEIKALLGSLLLKDEDGNPTGESLDIGALLKDLIKGALFTDNMINAVVGMLYPLVVTEFIKVWANDLPAKNQDHNISYIKSLYTIFKEANFNVYPDLLASKLNSTKYASNITVLKKATSQFNSEFGATGSTYYTLKQDGSKKVADKTPWDSAVLKRNVIDEETGEVVLNSDGTPKTEWALDWGVDEAREKMENGEMTEAEFDNFFYQAFDDAMEGLKPLLLALIANKSWSPSVVDHIADTKHTITIFWDIDLDIEVDLQLGATANRGYANLLVPIYEVLGASFTVPSTVEGYANNTNCVADIFKAILDPIFDFTDKLGANPLDTILGILPDVCYALSTQMVTPLLDMLKTSITYKAIPMALNDSFDASAFADISGKADISVGSMLDLNSLGVDLTDGINSLLSGFGLNLPQIDQGKVATLGKLTTISTQRAECIYTAPASGKAYHVEANKADVLLYIVDWALTSGVLDMFIETPEEEGLVKDLLTSLTTNPDGVIAAVAELLTLEKYDTLRNYEWFNGIIDGESVLGNSAYDIYLNPNNDWTKDKAEYLYNNIDALVGSILTVAGLDLDTTTEEVDGSIGEVISGAVDGLLSDSTLTSLAALLAKLDLNALLAGDTEAEEGTEATEAAVDVNALVNDLLGIDLSVFAEKYSEIAEQVEATKDSEEKYVHDFGVDKGEKTFAEALCEMIEPLNDVLDFILKGADLRIDLAAEGADAKDIVLPGYDGYNNALIPLLEALGCDVEASVDTENALEATINALVSRIDALTKGDVIKNIIDLLPGVVYFITSKGLSVSVRNLLQPVYVILDTIRPLIDVDLNELINGLIPEDYDIMLNIDDIGLSFVFDLLANLVPDLDLSALEDLIYDICDDIETEYTSVSTLQSEWKKGAYNDAFSQADLLTVVLSFVLEWATIDENAVKLDEMLGTNGIISSLKTVFADVEITYGEPDWMYWFDTEEAFDAYIASCEGLPNTLAALDWDNIGENDWDYTTALYFAENLDELVDIIIGMINKNKVDEDGNALPTTLSELLSDLVNGLVSAQTLNDLVAMITDLLADIDENLINTAGYLLDIDLAGLKAYTCEAEINTISDFINELAVVLDTYAGGLVNWLFFGDDYRFAKKSDSTDTIVINGGLGYEKGLAMIIEALGCELPAEANTKSVLGALATRVEEILADPVNEVIELLPNLVYFLNANGAGVAVNNLLQPVYALLDKLSAFGIEVNLEDLLKITKEDGTEIAIDLANLSLANVVEIVEGATGLPLDAAEAILVDFCTGKITKGTYIYRMDAANEDVVTILLVVVLELISDDEFAAKLDEMLGTDGLVADIKSIFKGSDISYSAPEWQYPLADNGTVDAMKYSITYPNNWTEATAQYVTENLPEIADLIAGLIDSNYDSLSALLKANVNVFTSESLQSIVELITDLLKDIDDGLLEAAGVLLDVDVVGLKKYQAPEGITTVDAFAVELANVLNTYAKGVVEWLLLGRDFELLVKDADGIDTELVTDGSYITITGAYGYSEGLALLLEALGCENLPASDGETEAIVTGVLTSVANLIDKVLNNPVGTIVDILPNVLYFLNANGVAAVVDNTLAALTALLEKLEVFGLEVDINELVNIKSLMGIEDTDATISLDDLSMKAVLEAVGLMTGLDLTVVEDVLVGFALGQVNEYDSVSLSSAYKMTYVDEFDKHDMVTVIINLVIITLADEANEAFVKELVGEDVYEIIINLCNGVAPVEIQEFDWKFTDKADTGEVFSALESSELYEGYGYGPLYTKEMAEYIADNFGTFVDNIIYLLGIEINGVSVDSLTELINGLLDGSLYNSSNVVAIRDALAGVLEGVEVLEVNGKKVGKYISAVLASSGVADISAVKNVEVPEFTEDRAKFVEALCDVLEPLYPVLKWVLADEDIAFFVDLDKTDLIKLEGAEGYAYGILPLLETLECQNILTPADYYAAVEADGDVLLTSILDPLLNRVDEIIAEDPASEILSMLPNLIYFINSNGVDTVVKNTLNAVYTLLSAIEPIAKIDLYELIGIDLSTLNFEKLFDMLLDLIADATGYEFENLKVDAVAELTVGTLESYTSLNTKTAYRMIYNSELSKAEMVTVILRLLVTFVMHENNREMLLGLLKDNLGMNEDAEGYLRGVLDSIASLATDTYLGMDQALAVIYYLFYSLDIGSAELATGIKDINAEWQNILKELSKSEDPDQITIGSFLGNFLDKYFEDVFTSEGFAPNGLIAFFQRIIEWFNKVIEWFKGLFD